MNAEMPCLPAAGSVTAKTSAMSALRPEVMNCLAPFRTNLLPTRSARVVIAAASEPAPGSVRQKAPKSSPRARGRRKRSFCCGVPWRRIGRQTSELCTWNAVDDAPSAAAISMMASA